MAKHTRRLLLATSALSGAALLAGCRERPGPPANPKGSFYDAEVLPLPGNPKGSFYDDAMAPTVTPPPSATGLAIGPPTAGDAAAKGGFATPPPKTSASGPVIHRLPANPKGSHYDKGLPTPTKD